MQWSNALPWNSAPSEVSQRLSAALRKPEAYRNRTKFSLLSLCHNVFIVAFRISWLFTAVQILVASS